MKTMSTSKVLASILTAVATASLATAGIAGHAHADTAPQINPTVASFSSTVPADGDVNPYGIAIVPKDMGILRGGNVLVSNFNSASQAGRGSTIVQISPNGTQTVFAQLDPKQLTSCNGVGLPAANGQVSGVGLTTALTVLRHRYIIVGALPTADGTPATAKAGCLIVLNQDGQVLQTINNPAINGPWDLTAVEGNKHTTLFVSNVLNGTVAGNGKVVNGGTVIRITLGYRPDKKGVVVQGPITTVASGFAERSDPNALVLGPTGVALAKDGTLYVADTLENRISAIPDALTRTTSAFTGEDLTAGGAINGPLGLAVAPNGDILAANGNDGNLVRISPAGDQLSQTLIDATGTPAGAGALFGLAVSPDGQKVYFGDDAANSLNHLDVAATNPPQK